MNNLADEQRIHKLGSKIRVCYDFVVLTNEYRGFTDFVYGYCDITPHRLALLVKTNSRMSSLDICRINLEIPKLSS